MRSLAEFEQHLWEAGIIDPDGIHSEFSQGLHGQKVDFDKIPDGSELFDEWVDITAETIDRNYPGPLMPEVLLGVAGGTNRLVGPVAKKLGKGTIGLPTKKVETSVVVLPPNSYRRVRGRRPNFLLVLEDTSTTGKNAASAARYAYKAGAKNVEALIGWQRQPTLLELTGVRVKYQAIIKHILPTYTAAECQATGFCADNWRLIEYGSKE